MMGYSEHIWSYLLDILYVFYMKATPLCLQCDITDKKMGFALDLIQATHLTKPFFAFTIGIFPNLNFN